MAPDPDDLQSRLMRASQGDSDAWRAIVREFAPRIHGLVRSNCKDAELAEEITQSTFCTVAAKLGDYVESGRFEAWIFRIAMNRLRDEMRRRARHARNAGDDAMADRAGAGTGVGGGGEELRESLRRAMSRLSDADREVIDLRHLGGMSFKALAEYFEEPIGTLLARHHRALRKLRAILEDMGIDGLGEEIG